MDYSAVKKEWIISNGLGGYSSSTVLGCNTRKYHGLLVANLNNSQIILLNKADEQVIVDGKTYDLATNEYDIIYPKGYEYMTGFSFDFYPEFVYEIKTEDGKKITIKKRIEMPNANLVLISYEIISEKKCLLRLIPLVSFRSPNEINRKRYYIVSKDKVSADNIDLYFNSDNFNFKIDEKIYYNFHYTIEKDRGYDFREDLFNPGFFDFEMLPGKRKASIVFSAEQISLSEAEKLVQKETCRKCEVLYDFYQNNKLKADDFVNTLVIAADSFISHDGVGNYIIAGFPWFSYYSRDGLVSFEGVFLCSKRYREAKIFLRGLIKNLNKGLLPNILTNKTASPEEMNSVDAPLLLILAVKKYVDYSNDIPFVKRYYTDFLSIIDNYIKGTYFGIKMGDDYLIKDDYGSLTWMDSIVNNAPVTERKKAVEIQVYWYNALRVMEEFSKTLKIKFKYKGLAEKVRCSFQKYWNGQYLNDNENDNSIRPNMLYEIAMPYSMLSRSQEKIMLKVAERELLTDFGLRTLSPKDKKYTGLYRGNQEQRDMAYHNGTIWPYLLGVYVDASLKLNPSKSNKERLQNLLYKIKDNLLAVNSLPEIYEASTLRPDGCISQAWSVAEVLRALVKLNKLKTKKEQATDISS